jgi:hypothetical protein
MEPDRTYGQEDVLLQRTRAEYRDMPGLKLTTEQASRLLGADVAACEYALERLVHERLLRRAADGTFIRAD